MKLYRFFGLPDDRTPKGKAKRQLHKFLESLKKSEIYMQCPSAYNDPFDSKAIFNNLTPVQLEEMDDYTKTCANDQPESIFANDFKRLPSHVIPTNRFLVCCFTREDVFTADENNIKYSDLMWAHYANNHYGVCLQYEFDVEQPSNNFISKDGYYLFVKRKGQKEDVYNPQINDTYPNGFNIYIKPVCYNNTVPDLLHTLQQDSGILDVITQKPESWKLEKEQRLIVQAPDECAFSFRNSYYLKYYPECLKKIILGYRTRDDCKKYISDVVSRWTSQEIVLAQNNMSPNDKSFCIQEITHPARIRI